MGRLRHGTVEMSKDRATGVGADLFLQRAQQMHVMQGCKWMTNKNGIHFLTSQLAFKRGWMTDISDRGSSSRGERDAVAAVQLILGHGSWIKFTFSTCKYRKKGKSHVRWLRLVRNLVKQPTLQPFV